MSYILGVRVWEWGQREEAWDLELWDSRPGGYNDLAVKKLKVIRKSLNSFYLKNLQKDWCFVNGLGIL